MRILDALHEASNVIDGKRLFRLLPADRHSDPPLDIGRVHHHRFRLGDLRSCAGAAIVCNRHSRASVTSYRSR
jgi:hypothetical protein